MTKPYRIITVYSNENKFEKQLKDLGVKFTSKPIFNRFNGTQFEIEKPMGKGAMEKRRQINKL